MAPSGTVRRFGDDPSSRHLEATLPTVAELTAGGDFTNRHQYAPVAYLDTGGMTYLQPGWLLHPDGVRHPSYITCGPHSHHERWRW